MDRKQIIQSLEPLHTIEDWSHQKRDDGLSNAAVLIPLVERECWHILLTRRTDHLHHHASQVSFPGGRADAVDISPLDTALRETFEEVGIEKGLIELVGTIEPYLTVTDFSVVPVVGFLDPSFELNIDEFEVAQVFEAPLSIVMDQSCYKRKEIFWKGENRFYWELMYEGFQIWGATAAMLYAFAERLNETIATQ
ncbi:MAG: coenzyme A pyrophosphatase [Cycloclasticus sp. symbiont of Poecilosclerida sp. N]|nr:MAG: coenzyme A pyrophosphatase [Cycloclasticus sp. symbiont of Poecilosclerida sp. N]